jgi:serine/threonine protein kinase
VDILIEKDQKRTTKKVNRGQRQNTLSTCKIIQSEFTVNNDEILGRGAFAIVYSGQYGGAETAVKVFDLKNRSVEDQSKLKKSMEKELQVMKRLNDSPRVIRMFGCCELPAEQKLLLLMEKAVGGTVTELLDNKKVVLSDKQKGELIYDTVLGMKYIHSKGVLHRDLKSLNLLLDDRGRVKVSDFGVSFMMSTQTSTQTNTSTSVGTTPWMAPELLAGTATEFSTACDVYSFGIVISEVITRITTLYPEQEGRNRDVQVRESDKRKAGEKHELYFLRSTLARVVYSN